MPAKVKTASTETGAAVPPPSSLSNGEDQETSAASEQFDLNKYTYRAPRGGVVKREQLVIPEGRPKDTYFRVDPREEMQWSTALLEYKPEGALHPDTYILAPDVAGELGPRSKPVVIRVCICRPDILKLWAVKVPQTVRGKPNGYTQSAWDALRILEKEWACLVTNESSTGYDVILAETQWPDPQWRNTSMGELVFKCYRGRFIDSMDHEVIQKIKGRI
jgi:hypothetical protein